MWCYFLYHHGMEGLPNVSEADGTAGINTMADLSPRLLFVWTALSSQKDYETANQANIYKY